MIEKMLGEIVPLGNTALVACLALLFWYYQKKDLAAKDAKLAAHDKWLSELESGLSEDCGRIRVLETQVGDLRDMLPQLLKSVGTLNDHLARSEERDKTLKASMDTFSSRIGELSAKFENTVQRVSRLEGIEARR